MILRTWVSLFLLLLGPCLGDQDEKFPMSGFHGDADAPTWNHRVKGISAPSHEHLVDVAHGYYNWVIDQDYHEMKGLGGTLVSALWVPDYDEGRPLRKGTLFVSTIPRDPYSKEVVRKAQEREDPPSAWLIYASGFLTPTSRPLHAEDGAYTLYEKQGGEIWNGQYPYGSMIATFGKRNRNQKDAEEVELCPFTGQQKIRKPDCKTMAQNLGVSYKGHPAAHRARPKDLYKEEPFGDSEIAWDEVCNLPIS